MTNNDRTIITQKSDKLTVISDEIMRWNSREDNVPDYYHMLWLD